MAYATLADLRKVLTPRVCLQLLDDDNDGNEDAAAVSQVLGDATALFNGYVGREYRVSVIEAAPPPLCKRIVLAIATEYAWQRRPELVSSEGKSPVRVRYEDAIKQLEMIGGGKLRLDVDAIPQDAANVQVSFVADGTVMTPATNDDGTHRFGDF